MIEISTPKTHSLQKTEVIKDISAEDISEEDQSFYTEIRSLFKCYGNKSKPG